MRKIHYLLFMILFVFSSSLANDYTYHEIREWHNDRIRNVLKVNSVESRIDFALDIYKNPDLSNSISEKEKIKLPGLLVNMGSESGKSEGLGSLFSKEDLSEYVRQVTLVSYKIVEPEVLEKVKVEISEALYFTSKDNLKAVNSNPFPYSEAQFTETRGNSFSQMYDVMAKKSLLLWVLLLCGITLYVLLELKKIMNEASSKISEAILDMQSKNAASLPAEEKDKEGLNSGLLEASENIDQFNPDVSVLISNLFTAIQKYPGHFLASIYKVFNEPDSLVKFFNFLDQSNVTEDAKKKKDVVLDFMKEIVRTARASSIGSTAVDINESVRALSNVLTALKFLKVSPNAEKIYQAMFFKARNKYSQFVEKLANDYFEIIYFLFPDDLKIYMKKNPELLKEFSSKIVQINATGLDIDSVNDLDVQKFLNEIIILELDPEKNNYSLDSSFGKMLYYLSDEELNDLENESTQDLISQIPKIAWLKGSDRNVLKNFILSLDPYELKLLSGTINNFETILNQFDPRSAFRVRENLSMAMSNVEYQNNNLWYNLRLKIAMFYKSPSNKINHSTSKIANNASATNGADNDVKKAS